MDGRTDAVAIKERELLDELEAAHTDEHMGERQYAEDAWYQGETRPSKMTTIRIDAPTQHQFDLPRQRRVARDAVKALEGARKWSSKISGAQVAGVGMWACIARAALGGGPNLVGTVLLFVLSAMAAEGAAIGGRLMLILDNTSGENKCDTIIGLLAWLVWLGWFEQTGFFCMLKGHTYNELDQSFNTLIKSMLQYAIYTVSRLAQLMQGFLQPYGVRPVVVLEQLWDISGLLRPHMHDLGGYCSSQHGDGMHEFRLKKDQAGTVRLHMRKSSKASGWIPEGPGYEVFKTTPPPISSISPAPFKADAKWERGSVEATLRRWFPLMALSESHLQKTQSEWTDRCFSLPPNMSATDLPASSRLPIPTLPVRDFDAERAAGQLRVNNPSVRLENPVVDPTHGPGRTANQVRNETAAYRDGRRAANITGPTPVFQADYLFIQLPGTSLALHTVCNGAYLQEAEEDSICFTTCEYEHTPGDDPGFWGTFTKKLNDNYDPHNPKSGTKFVRHNGVGRSCIVLYNVQVFKGSDGCLRVSHDSLEDLSRLRSEYPMPCTTPPTHTSGGAAGAQGGGPRGGAGSRGGRSGRGGRGADRRRVPDDEDQGEEEDEAEEGEEDGVESEDGSEDGDEVPAPIPPGFVDYEWDDHPVLHFVAWVSLGSGVRGWHVGKVDRALKQGRADGFTHDVIFQGTRYRRAISLTQETAASGCLVLLRRIEAQQPDIEAPDIEAQQPEQQSDGLASQGSEEAEEALVESPPPSPEVAPSDAVRPNLVGPNRATRARTAFLRK